MEDAAALVNRCKVMFKQGEARHAGFGARLIYSNMQSPLSNIMNPMSDVQYLLSHEKISDTCHPTSNRICNTDLFLVWVDGHDVG